VLPHRADVKLEGAALSAKYLAANERADASTRVVLHRLPAGGAMPEGPLGEGEVMAFDEAVYSLGGGAFLFYEARGRGWGGVLGCLSLFHTRPSRTR
jgi:hypothetical protein